MNTPETAAALALRIYLQGLQRENAQLKEELKAHHEALGNLRRAYGTNVDLLQRVSDAARWWKPLPKFLRTEVREELAR